MDLPLRAARWLTAELATAYGDALRDLYDDLGGDGPVRLGDLWFVAQGPLFGPGDRPVDRVAAEFAARWERVLGLAGLPAGTTRVEFAAAELAPLVADAFPAGRPGWSAGRVHSPDLQLFAESPEALAAGEFGAVLGELHAAYATFNAELFTHCHPDVDRLRRAYAADLGPGRLRPLYPVDFPRVGGRLSASLHGPDDHRLAFADAPGAPRDRLVPANAAIVSEVDGVLVATGPDGTRWPLVEVFSDLIAVHAGDAFKLMTDRPHSPRVTVDRLVLARETWRTTVGATGLADAVDQARRYLAVRRWRTALGLPERVFVRVATELKPTYVDLTSPALRQPALPAAARRPAVRRRRRDGDRVGAAARARAGVAARPRGPPLRQRTAPAHQRFGRAGGHGVNETVEPIAIVGLSLRVPGAASAEEFWRNLVVGAESLTRFTRAELLARGVPAEQLDDPAYVPVAAVLDGVDRFDAELFGLSPRDAELTDPQQRLFLEHAHAALTDAGCDPARYDGEIGVYAGGNADLYQWLNVRRNPRALADAGELRVSLGNKPDYLASTVAFRLGLRGPAMTVQTACSSSLVAVHLAAEALRSGECDTALAGGVCVELPHGVGYVADEGYTSADGHCRPFDADADGTVYGSGVGVVVLKRLSDALADGDDIRALVIGNAVNNDGSAKASFTAPSVTGQVEVVTQALAVAGVAPRSVGYVEAHGTGTVLGDSIELAALSTAYGRRTAERGWCGVGSTKANIGHLSAAGGVIGLIKTVLSMRHRLIPPTVNHDRPHPDIDIEASPFYVVSTLTKWEPEDQRPLRAGVSSLGLGGTNAHLVLQEAPPRVPPEPDHGGGELLQVSAATPDALAAACARLAERLTGAPDVGLRDVAYTLREGRPAYRHRAAVVAVDRARAAAALTTRSAGPPGTPRRR
ncbi:beta-ketoacyl synthase N-terminal-like domain-containing protein, partial [Micromonospora sp. M42]|uniref:beta-ketoacyl synthase N-terminal-like domain-containing protein n=1 Tax=Micromonospora sp. M42 TaxID=457406 RepID=UPI001CB7942E